MLILELNQKIYIIKAIMLKNNVYKKLFKKINNDLII